MSDVLDELLNLTEYLDPEDLAEIDEIIDETEPLKWIPNPGPQMMCIESEAYITLYGGAGGGGKSDLLIGLALTEHKRSLLVRQQYNDLAPLIDRTLEIYGTRRGFRGSSPPRLTTEDRRLIEFGATGRPGEEQHWQGNPHDFLGIDEVTQMQESQARFLLGWVRTSDPEQRCRIVFASNPPVTGEAAWIIDMFAPWLDETHPNPARPGELRWFITDDDGKDKEVPTPHVVTIDDVEYIPHSRTFIPAKLRDNPDLERTGYKAALDAMKEPWRSAIRDGEFGKAIQDHDWQLIPTAWIKAAQDRWTPEPPPHSPMCAIGVDVAEGGDDKTCLARRHDAWFDRVISVPGEETPLGGDVAALVVRYRRSNATVILDRGGGYGGAAQEALTQNNIPVIAYKGAMKSLERSRDKVLGFKNRRTEIYYRLYEALDPDQPGGSMVALPPDRKVLSDLSSILLQPTMTRDGKIELEPKKDLVKRLGYSTDEGDAIAMAWSEGPRISTSWHHWREYTGPQGRPKVIHGHQAARRRMNRTRR